MGIPPSASLPIIDPNQFQSASVKVSLTNTTTHTELRDGQKLIGGHAQKVLPHEDLNVTLVELLDRGVVLEVPPNTCSKGHNLLLELEAIFPHGERAFFKTTSKTEKTELTDGTRVTITVNFVQFEEENWKKFKKAFNSRQDEIFEFFKAAKG